VTAHALLATCARLGVSLTPEGDGLRVRGPRPARDELLPEIRKLKPELLKVLRAPATLGTSGTTTKPLAPMGWGYDWRGALADLRGARPGEDGRPPIFMSAKPEGLQ
jgi:hypothetical protein